MAGLKPSSPSRKASLAKATQVYHEQLLEDEPARRYLESRGLLATAGVHLLGVVRSPRGGHERFRGRLAIPYIGPAGNVYAMDFRCIEDHSCKEQGHSKYDREPGVATRIYNTRALVAPTDFIFVCEGPPDAATLVTCGWPAVGIPGANGWKDHYSRCFDGFSDVVVVADGDDEGRRLAAKVVKSVPHARSVIMGAGEDVNSVFVKGGKAALVEILKGGAE